MLALPMLESRRTELETCAYCPKLCRSACPVSNAEPRETLTPWGKMTTAYLASHGDVPLDASFAKPAWACTGCGACAKACDHNNDVAGALGAAREGFSARGLAPDAAKRIVRDWQSHLAATQRAVAAHASGARSATALLVGCTYSRRAGDVARDALAATTGLVGDVVVIDLCCGAPLKMAGDRPRFEAHAADFAARLRGFKRLVVVDPGCAMLLKTELKTSGMGLEPEITLLVEEAAAQLAALSPGNAAGPPRFHEPCQLGRGLGLGTEARAVLTRLGGRAPLEFTERGGCSGAGGLLPVTLPDVSRAIAATRIAEHNEAGGGPLVTACASSLLSLRRAGGTSAQVSDLTTWIARSVAGKTA